MSIVPNRLQEGTSWRESIPLINDNFDKVTSEVGDLGAHQTTTTRIQKTVAAGTSFSETVAIVNPSGSSAYSYVTAPTPLKGVSALVPAMDVYIDTDSDSTYLYPVGTALSSEQKNLVISAKLDLTKADSSPATLTISGRNYGASQHVYYIYIKASYFPSAPTGTFR